MTDASRRAGYAACFIALCLLLFAGLSGCSDAGESAAQEAPATLELGPMSVQLPVVAGRPGALYGEVRGGAEADRLVAVSAGPDVRAEMHETLHEGGVMRMEPREAFDVPAGGTLALTRGGKHIMLFGLPEVEAGTPIPLILTFEKAGPVTAEAATVAAGAAGH